MKKPMEQALQIAGDNLKEIVKVQEWADEMNYRSLTYFSQKFRNHYGIRPKTKMIEIRVEKFFELIEKNPKMSCYEIALELGLRDEIGLSKFIKRHTGKSPNEWRNFNKNK